MQSPPSPCQDVSRRNPAGNLSRKAPISCTAGPGGNEENSRARTVTFVARPRGSLRCDDFARLNLHS
jgi:hypothetical protein